MAVSQVGTPAAVARITVTGTLAPAFSGTQPRTAGDVLLLYVSVGAVTSSNAFPAISGWNQLTETVSLTSRSCWYWRIATGADAAPSFTVTFSGTGAACASLHERTGNDPTTPILTEGSGSGAAASEPATTSGSVTPTGCNGLTGFSQFTSTAATRTWTPGSGWGTVVTDNTVSTRHHHTVDDLTTVPTGSTLTETGTLSTTPTSFAASIIVVQPPVVSTTSPAKLSTRRTPRRYYPQPQFSSTPGYVSGGPDFIPRSRRHRPSRFPIVRSADTSPPKVVVPPPPVKFVLQPPPRRVRRVSHVSRAVAVPVQPPEAIPQDRRTTTTRRSRIGSRTQVPGGIGTVFQPLPALDLRRAWKLRWRRVPYAAQLPPIEAPPPAFPAVRRWISRYRRQRGNQLPVPGGVGAVFQPLPALSLYRRVFRYRRPEQNAVAPSAPQVSVPAVPAPFEPRNRVLRWKAHRGNVHQLPGPTTTPVVAVFAPFAPLRSRIRWTRWKSNAVGVPVTTAVAPVAPTVPDTHRVRRNVRVRRIRPPQVPGQIQSDVFSQLRRKGVFARTRRATINLPTPISTVTPPRIVRRVLPKRRITTLQLPSVVKPPTLAVTAFRRLSQRFWHALKYRRRAGTMPGPTVLPLFGPPPEVIGCTVSVNYLSGTVVVVGYLAVVNPSTYAVGSIGPDGYYVTISIEED